MTHNPFQPLYDEVDALRTKLDRLREALSGFSDDFMTSEKHHPDYVLIPTKKFEAIVAAIVESK